MQFVVFLLAALLALPASAIEFATFQPAGSRLEFVSTQMNVPVEGRFKKFSGKVRFDPAQPAQGQASIEIEVASIDTGLAEADEEVVGKAWFNAKQFPIASFVSSSVKPLGDNRYQLNGKLTIKGQSKEVSTPVSFKQQDKLGIFEGAFTIKRADYALGEGIWADFDAVANEIKIKFRIAAAAN